MKVGWTRRRSNVSILETVGSGRELMPVVRREQMAFFGHIVRANGLENLVVTGRIAGTGSRGRPRKKHSDQMKEVIGEVATQQLLNMTRDHERLRSITGNVFNNTPHR